jgi:hypothetical protein
VVTALALAYAPHVPWLAVYQPPLGAAVVVHTVEDRPQAGAQIPLAPPATE